MRVLFFVHRFPPDDHPLARFAGGVARALRGSGHRVTVVTSRPRGGVRSNGDGASPRSAAGDEEGIRVVRQPAWRWGAGRWRLARALNHVSYNVLGTLSSLYALGPFDVALCTDASGLTGVAASVLRRLREVPFVYVLRDEGLPPLGNGAGTTADGEAPGGASPFDGLRSRLEPGVYRRASRLVVTAPAYRERLSRRGVPRPKVTVIPDFVDTEFFRPLSRDNVLARSRGLADKFVAAYAGGSDAMHGLDAFLEAAFLLRGHGSIRWVIGAHRAHVPTLRGWVEDRGLENVILVPSSSPDTLRWLRAASDVGVVFRRDGPPVRSLPRDTYEVMAAGRALAAVAEADTDLGRLVETVGAGVRVEPGDPEALADAVERLERAPELRVEMGGRARAAAERNFSLEAVGQAYDRVLRKARAS